MTRETARRTRFALFGLGVESVFIDAASAVLVAKSIHVTVVAVRIFALVAVDQDVVIDADRLVVLVDLVRVSPALLAADAVAFLVTSGTASCALGDFSP